MNRNLDFEISDEQDCLHVPFDDATSGKYEFKLVPEQADNGDGILLALNCSACESIAKIFMQLSRGKFSEGYHTHLGYSEEEPMGSGFRIMLVESSRIDGEKSC